MDFTHLHALELRLSHERSRYAQDNSEIRKVWIAQMEKEIVAEKRFLGIDYSADRNEISADKIAKELGL